MEACDACAGRGWGIWKGRIRMCEVCCQLEGDEEARAAADRELVAYRLRERPEVKVLSGDRLGCPHCDHVASGLGDDRFLDVIEVLSCLPVEIERREEEPVLTSLIGHGLEDYEEDDDARLECPECRGRCQPPRGMRED